MAHRRGLSAEDIELWAAYSRTLSRLLPGRPRLTLPPAPAPVTPPAPPTDAQTAVEQHPPAPRQRRANGPTAKLDVNAPPVGLDKSTWSKFRLQKIRAEARLDLHGHTAMQAHGEVLRFLQMSHATGLRCVEIITGNGEILARELPHWLNTPSLRPMILSLAHPHARNSGSVRILLRRRRT